MSYIPGIWIWLGIITCITLSALFAGLNLAIFSLSQLRLQIEADSGNNDAARVLDLRKNSKPTREFPRICRGGSKSLTYPEVGSLGPWTGLQTVSHQAHERSPANGVATRSKATRLQMDGLPESEVRMSEKHTRFLGRHSAMRVGMRIDAARTSRFERLQS